MKREHTVLRALLDTVKRLKLLTVLILLVVLGAVAAALLPPLALEKAVNLLTAGESIPLTLVMAYFLLNVLTCLLDAGRESLLTVYGQKITRGLRHAMCAKLSRLPADFFATQESGVTVSRFVGDVDTLETLFTSGIISMFADACKVVSIMAVIFVKNRGLAVLLLLLLPPLFLFTRAIQKRMLAAQLANRAAVGKAAEHVPETIRTIRTTRLLRKMGFMRARYDQRIDESYAAMEKTNFYDAVYSPVILLLNAAVVAAVMLLSATGNDAIHAFFGMSAGTAVAVIAYISQVFSPLESIGMEIQTIQSAVAGMHRIGDFLALPQRWPTSEEAAAQLSLDGDAPCVVLEDVHFAYDETPVLTGVSFRVAKGEQVTLAGRTGVGKSTVFKLLLGLYRPQRGTVRLYGQDAALLPDSVKRRLIGYVEQSFRIMPGTVLDQITLQDETITREAAVAAAKLAGLHETILQKPQGYDTPCESGLFSQGQWQLLAIARAVAAKPQILLLDEITANLDAETEKTVLAALRKASADRTVISVSHRLYEQGGMRQILL